MVTIKTPEEIAIMKEGGKILAQALHATAKLAKPGVTTLQLDKAAEQLILDMGGKPAFKGYEGFPFSLCTSVNENVVHGYPSDYVLKDGDLVKLDLGVLYKGFNTDMAVTVAVGKVSAEVKELMDATRQSMMVGIKQAVAGNTTGDIGHAVQEFLEGQGYGVVTSLCGHGIGREVHEDPQVPNFGEAGIGTTLQEGMVICIEPMVTIGNPRLVKSEDGYGYRSKDNSLTAHFELTVAITNGGPKILTAI